MRISVRTFPGTLLLSKCAREVSALGCLAAGTTAFVVGNASRSGPPTRGNASFAYIADCGCPPSADELNDVFYERSAFGRNTAPLLQDSPYGERNVSTWTGAL